MQRLLLVALLVAAVLALPAHARAAGQCGLPRAKPLWIDHGNPELLKVFGRPGTVVTSSSGDFPARVRATGAKTLYWDMYLNRRVGTPTAPADPATIGEKADRLYEFAAAQTACRTPWIALNELFGANLETPWSASNAQYRANVLAFVRRLAERGARPFLLLSRTPNTDGEAAAWWREVGRHADLVPEVYFSAPPVYRQGPILANRRIRLALRRSIAALTAVGIRPARIGVVLGFQTKEGGRDGLQPAHAWFRLVKWQAFAARQVASETGIATIWSWGWAAYGADRADPDKAAAACVYLWARDPSLCDGPAAAGPRFNASREEGQILLPPGRLCAVGERTVTASALAALTRVTGDRDIAFAALLARLAESPHAEVASRQVLAAERAVVAVRFRGHRAAYRAALRRAGSSVAVARAVLADELRRLRLEARMRGRAPSADEITTFYFSYPELLVRAVRAKPAPSWLGGRRSGLALHALAPERVFSLRTGRPAVLRGLDKPYRVTALADARPLGSVPLAQARPAIAAALAAFARRATFERWSVRRQAVLAARAVCRGDEVPEPSSVRMTAYLPFLSLTGV